MARKTQLNPSIIQHRGALVELNSAPAIVQAGTTISWENTVYDTDPTMAFPQAISITAQMEDLTPASASVDFCLLKDLE